MVKKKEEEKKGKKGGKGGKKGKKEGKKEKKRKLQSQGKGLSPEMIEEGVEESQDSVKKEKAAKRIKPKKIISKRYIWLTKQVDKDKLYTAEEAIEIAKQTAKTKFDGSIEIHIRLGIDIKKSDQHVRGTVTLPHGSGKTKKIVAFVDESKTNEAKEAGADIVGSVELIEKINKTKKIDFEIAVATPDMMPKLASIAKILGPKGLMPSPKSETITTNITKTIGELKKGKVNFKNDDTGNIHSTIGKASFDEKQLLENYTALLGAIKKAKPLSIKGIYILRISMNATMGPGIHIVTN